MVHPLLDQDQDLPYRRWPRIHKIKTLLCDIFVLCLVIFQCEKYRKGVIGGSACSSLCEKDTLYLGKCFSAKPGSQVSAHALLHGHASPVDFLFAEDSAPPPPAGVLWELGGPGGSDKVPDGGHSSL